MSGQVSQTWFQILWEQAQNSPTTIISIIGLTLSTALFCIKIWEAFFKDRVRIDTTYLLSGETGGQHEIVIANLSPLPIQVAHWTLAWEPRWLAFWLTSVDVTTEHASRFTIGARDDCELTFGGEDHFVWNGKVAAGRQLVLRLKLFGRRRWIKLVIGAGQEPDWSWNIRKRLPRLRRKCDNDL